MHKNTGRDVLRVIIYGRRSPKQPWNLFIPYLFINSNCNLTRVPNKVRRHAIVYVFIVLNTWRKVKLCEMLIFIFLFIVNMIRIVSSYSVCWLTLNR